MRLLHRCRLGQYLLTDAHIGGRVDAGEGRVRREWRHSQRRLPGERTAECARAWAQAHWEEIVAGIGEARARKADEKSAAIDPTRQRGAIKWGQRTGVGQDQRLRTRIDQL